MGVKHRRLWIWEAEEHRLYQTLCVGSVLHVCCGHSLFGDVRVDRYTNSVDVHADYRWLPFKDKSFDSVICDPPWAKSERLDAGIIGWLRELDRVTRHRIVIIHTTMFQLPGWKLIDAYCVRAKGLLWKVVQVHERVIE